MLTDGTRIYGTCLGRTLHYVERKGLFDCEICGFPHIHHDPKADYWGMVVALEPITHETWTQIPDGFVWAVSPDQQSYQITPIQELAIQSSSGS